MLAYIVAALVLFMAQRITAVSAMRLARQARRRLKRAAAEAEFATGLRVVTLRRTEYRGATRDESAHVDWSCQWVVSGHWRQP